MIGTGSIGMRHLNVLSRIDEVQAIGIPKRVERRRELEGAGFRTATNPGEARHMGARLCIVASDTGKHAQDARSAAESGLDLLVEKPLSTDAADARRLCLEVAGADRKLFVGCVLRFSESLNAFRERLGRIGRLHFVRIECQSYLPDWRPARPYREAYCARADEGGVMRDLIHEIDYAGWVFGWPAAVQARVRNLGRLGIAAEEAADLLWENDDGALVSMSLDYLSRPSRRLMRAAGELGTLEWDGILGTVSLAVAGAPVEVFRSSQTRDETFLAQARAFLDACRGISDPRLATGEDGVKGLAVCDSARRAARSRREERVDYP